SSYSFFYSCSRHPRSPHSFPTRRSSDLTATHDTKRSEDVRARLALLAEIPDRWREAVERWAAHNERHRRDGLPDRNTEYLLYQRSEEHTSELQSRENLVCRLLLEKKKQI